MDLGVITSEGVGEAQAATSINAVGSDPFGINISTSIGSGLLKQQRSGTSLQDSWRASKLPRPNEFGGSFFSQNQNPTTLLRSGSMIPSTNGQTMISFSSQSQTPLFPEEDGVKTSAFPFFLSPSQEQQLSSKTSEKAAEAIRGPFARFRGPFTPSQWMELEHQALIYKHILANVPVPSHLLIPLKKSFNPYAFTGFSPGSYGSSSLVGWGSFHLGFAGSTDPEPGRCRRTDGKKWRCSRDAVPDQKYCERHINRGRHRSRKPVEGQTGHAVSGSTAPKVALNASSSSASVMSSSNVSNCLGAVQHQFKNMQPGPAAANTANEHLVSRMQDLQSQGISVLGDAMNLKSKDSSFSSQKPHGLLGGSSQPEFGIVSPHSLLNPSQKSSRLNSRETDSFTSFNEQDARGQHPLRHFIDNWPKDRSDRGSVTWPEELKSDWTQLSMSIPMSSSEFSSSSNSPPQEKTTLSPLRLAREIDHIQMGLSVNNNDLSGQNQKQQHSNWLPVSWGSSNSSSLGGPLGEVLNSTTYSSVVGGGSKNSSSALNLMTEVWVDGNSPQMGCSPTGVLQKSTFVTLSNSSSGSSPRGDNNNNNNNNKKAPKNASLCDDILGSTLVSSASIPSI